MIALALLFLLVIVLLVWLFKLLQAHFKTLKIVVTFNDNCKVVNDGNAMIQKGAIEKVNLQTNNLLKLRLTTLATQIDTLDCESKALPKPSTDISVAFTGVVKSYIKLLDTESEG